ncbi:FHA domain-containing protein [Streptomyces sp. UH6]|uniref:FHA domain-containing protein n=1 Tax=Streptomyces sp. UH6 TaxID=2748379 RepID=UPI0015D48B04|nr:FHA domain-containing protein [Streptomyces sp. UH6]NYV78669.1 FHA domain-containing protein [Streptomyces sp. UH6]
MPPRPRPPRRRRATALLLPAGLLPVGLLPVVLLPAVLLLDFTGLGRHLRVARGGTVRLGRSTRWATPEAADLLADERTVSGRHADVEFAEDGRVWLTEVPRGSSNGTRVNGGLALTPGHRHEIHNGDTVELGPRVEFLVRRPTPHRGATAP